jgi:hypothetical protein
MWNAKRASRCARPNAKGLRAFSLAVFLVTISSSSPALNAESNGTSEYEVKAAFLFHFAQFVEWPAETFKDAETPLTYCTMGEDVFRGALDESVMGKRINNRGLRVVHLREREPIDGCQVLFIAAAPKGRQADELAIANGHPVLTVGESEHFTRDGGIIGFCMEEKKVRFEINLKVAEKAQLKISARLLALAKTVLGSPKGD